jgi:hypothetical protein
MEKAKLAIHIATKYGIVEYESARVFRKSLGSRFLAYLSLLRPVADFVPMLLVTTRLYGFRKGFVEAIKRQYLKLWFRWQVLRNVKSRVPNVCEVIGR